MPYIDGGAPTVSQWFVASNVSSADAQLLYTCPDGFVARFMTVYVQITWAQVNGQRLFNLQVQAPDGTRLSEWGAGFDNWGGAAATPGGFATVSYGLGEGTPTSSFLGSGAAEVTHAVVVIPNMWLPAGCTLKTHTDSWIAGDAITSLSGLVQLREDTIGNTQDLISGAGGAAGRGINAIPWLLPTP